MNLEDVESTIFPGGEVHIKSLKLSEPYYNHLYASITNSDDLVKLLLATDAFKRQYGFVPELYLPYIPYARQDRVANRGEALSIKVLADLINLQNYPKVHVLDPHSDVSAALINNVCITDCTAFAKKVWDNLPDEYADELIIIAPDAGALKKTHKIAKVLKYDKEVIFCEKKRDTKTGEITGTKVYFDDIKDKMFIIFDDICDGGRTFIEIAKVLKEQGAKKVILAISHGIFSKGLEVIFEYIDELLWTDSFKHLEETEFSIEFKKNGKFWAQYSALELMSGWNEEQFKKDLRKAV